MATFFLQNFEEKSNNKKRKNKKNSHLKLFYKIIINKLI